MGKEMVRVRNKIMEFKVAYKIPGKDSLWGPAATRSFYSTADPVWIRGNIIINDRIVAKAEDVVCVTKDLGVGNPHRIGGGVVAS